jgi:Spy/CpxP family protein refolding chaperone
MSVKKRRFGKWFWVTVTAAGMAATVVMLGCARYSTPEQRAAAAVDHVAWELELDNSQQANAQQVADIILEMRSALRGVDGERHQQLFDLMTAESFDTGQAQSLYEQSRLEMDQYVPKLIHAYSVFHAGLSARQRQELGERLQRLHDHHH